MSNLPSLSTGGGRSGSGLGSLLIIPKILEEMGQSGGKRTWAASWQDRLNAREAADIADKAAESDMLRGQTDREHQALIDTHNREHKSRLSREDLEHVMRQIPAGHTPTNIEAPSGAKVTGLKPPRSSGASAAPARQRFGSRAGRGSRGRKKP